MRKLRGHHLICMQQFQGMGYSDAFTKNMSEIINNLNENPSEEITVLKSMDDICAKCPNKLDEEHCALTIPGKKDSSVKDAKLVEVLGLELGKSYTYQEIRTRIIENIDAAYDACCKGCGWEKKGTCSLERLKNSYS